MFNPARDTPTTAAEARAFVEAGKALARRSFAKTALPGRRAVALPMIMFIGRQSVLILSFADASRKYEAVRDASGLGASKLPSGRIFRGDTMIARVSYNGRVWPPEPWTAEQQPLYDNQPRRGRAPC